MEAFKGIAAIPTCYGPHLFRSRTEARWGIFLHRAGYRFDYEAEGLALPTGWYLPDFWVHSLSTIVEVKPGGKCPCGSISEPSAPPEPPPPEIRRALDVVRASPEVSSVLVTYGDPYCIWEDRTAINVTMEGGAPVQHFHDLGPLSGLFESAAAYDFAVEARRARFEHGETPVW